VVRKWAKALLIISGVLTGISAFVGIGLLTGISACIEELYCRGPLLYLLLVGPYFLTYFFYRLGRYGWSIVSSLPSTIFALAFLAIAVFILLAV